MSQFMSRRPSDCHITMPTRCSERAPLCLPVLTINMNERPLPTPDFPRPLLLPTFVAANTSKNCTFPRPPPTSQPTFQHSAPVPIAMPTQHSDLAPYFLGRFDNPIEDFLNTYKKIVDSCGLSGQQKVEAIIRYIPYSHRALWKSLDCYAARECTEFRLNLEEIYNGPSVPSRHSEQRVLDFVRESSKLCMNDEADVLHYYRDFLALSKLLLDLQCLSIHRRDKAFWLGFHPRDRSEMYARLIAKHPDQPSGVYFDYLDVYRVVRATFSGNRLLDFELGDAWDKPQSLRANRPERARDGSTGTSAILEERTSGHTSGDARPHLRVTRPGKHPIDAPTPNHLNLKPRPRSSDSRTQLGKRRSV